MHHRHSWNLFWNIQIYRSVPHTDLPKASLKGRVRDANAKKLIAKQLGGLMDDVPSFCMQTGQIKTKKAKKEKTPEDMAVQELKQLEKKHLEFNELGILYDHISYIISRTITKSIWGLPSKDIEGTI